MIPNVHKISFQAGHKAVLAGQMMLLGAVFCVVAQSAQPGATVIGYLTGAGKLKKKPGAACTAFEAAFFDPVDAVLTPEPVGLSAPVGFFTEDAGADETDVDAIWGVGIMPDFAFELVAVDAAPEDESEAETEPVLELSEEASAPVPKSRKPAAR